MRLARLLIFLSAIVAGCQPKHSESPIVSATPFYVSPQVAIPEIHTDLLQLKYTANVKLVVTAPGGSEFDSDLGGDQRAVGLVRIALQQFFRKAGFRLSERAPIALEVRLQKWRTDSEGQSVIKLATSVVDAFGEEVFSSEYQGGSHAIPVKSLSLGQALEDVLLQYSQDRELLLTLSSF